MARYPNRMQRAGHLHRRRPHGLLARLRHGWSARQAGADRQRQRPQVEEYEPRLLYSADPAGFGMALATGGDVVEQRVIGADGEYVSSSAPAPGTAALRRELLIVGAGVEDSETLLDGLASDERDIEVVVLDPERDSIAQITEALAARRDLSAIHILSHGNQGMLQLGATALDSARLAARAGEIGLWGEALQSGGDILLYGCDVAAGSTGDAFVRQLAALTGADVAASTNLTGAGRYQGDWTLEYRTASIETGIAFSSAAQAQWGGLLETLVNGNPANTQDQAAIAISSSGNFVVVWTADHAEDGDKHGVFGQLFSASGNRIGANFQVNTDFKDEQQNATVGFAADGTFVVAWASHSGLLGDSNGWSIRAQRFQADGTKAGSEFLVNQLTAGDQTLPSIAVAADGQFVVAWYSNQGNDVYVRHFDAAGNARSGDILVNTIVTDGTQTSPQVAWAGDSYIVTWQSDRGGSGKAVFAQIMSSSDVPAGAGFRVNTYDANDQTAPVIAGNSSGAYVISWVSAGQDGAGNGIYAQLYRPVTGVTPSPVPYGAEFRVNTVTDKDQTAPSAAMDGSGNFLISWTSKGEDSGDTLGVYAQRYSANGATLGGPFRVNTTTALNQSLAVVTMNAAGAAAVAWEGNGVGDTDGVFVANYVPANNPPVATPDIVNITQDDRYISPPGGVLANDTDADAGAVLAVDAVRAGNSDTALAVTAQGTVVNGAYGTLLIRSDGSYEYTAGAAARALAAGQTASDVFAYFIHDNNNAGASSTLTFNVLGKNDAPTAVDDSYAVFKGSDLVVAAAGLLANDRDPDQTPAPDSLVVLAAVYAATSSAPGQTLRGQYGSLSFSANGGFSYVLDGQDPVASLQAGDSLTETFTYQMADSSGAVSSATLRIFILGKNTAPTAVDDGGYEVQEDGQLVVAAPDGVLANDTDDEGKETLSAVLESGPSHGTLVLNTDGSFIYTPDPAYFGTDSFTYRTSDGSLVSNPATVVIAISHVNHAPVAEADGASLLQDASLHVSAANGLLGNDTDVDAGDQLSILAVQSGDSTAGIDPGSSISIRSDYGLLTIASDGSYSYLADGQESRALGQGAVSSDIFTYTISDGKGGTASATLVITITGANDAPTISNTAAGQQVNDNGSLQPFSAVTIADIDSPAQQLTVTIALDDAARGSLSSALGGSYSAGVYTYTGSAEQVNAVVRSLKFMPAENRVAPAATETTGFIISVSDGAATATNSATTVVSTSINDAPVITGTVGGQAVNDNAGISPFAGVTIADADKPSQQLTVRVTLDSAANGALGNLGGGGYDAAGGVYTFVGTAAQATAALRGLVFTPTANRLAPGDSETTRFAITAYDGEATGMDQETSVLTTSVNDAPVISGAQSTYSIGDNGDIRPFSTVVISDADQPAQQLTTRVALDNPAKGTLSNLGGGSYNALTGVYTFVGSAAQATAALQGLVFNPAANRIAPGFIETTNFTITTDDGQAQAVDASTSVTSTSINDAPVITGTVGGQAVNDNAGISPFAGVTIADADNPSQQLTVRVTLDSAARGALGNLGGGSYDAAGGVYTFVGTAAQATAALRGLVFTPAQNRLPLGAIETTTLTLAVNDGLATATDSTTTVDSLSVNDVPVITGTLAGQAVNDKSGISPFAGVTIADADNPSQQLTVQVTLDSAARGTLGNLGGGTYDANSGIYTFAGTAVEATAALRGLVFSPTENRVPAGTIETTGLTLTVSDGIATSTDTTTTVDSLSVNDAPVIAGALAGQAVNDNASLSPFAGVTIGDADNPAQQLTVQVTLDSAARGALGNLGGGSYDSALGIYTFTGTAAGATAALRALVFSPVQNRVAPGAVETTTLTLVVNDGIASTSDSTTTVDATSINDAPSIAGASGGQAVNDNASISPFAGVTIADADSPSQQLTVRVTLDSAARGALGNLGGGGYDAANGVFTFTGTAAQATAALRALVFTPTENRVPPGASEVTRFTISASDGMAGASDASAAVASLSVNDAPTIGGIAAEQRTNDKSSMAPFANVTLADADNPAQQLTVQVTLDSAARGMLSSLGGGAYDAAAGIYRFTGTASQATAALRGLVFTPTGNRVTPDSTDTTIFSLALADESGALAQAVARVITSSINDAPVGMGAAVTGQQDASALLAVLLMADDADADPVSIVIVDLPAHGTLYLDAAGTQPLSSGATLSAPGNAARVYFRPEGGWAGEARFSYAAIDAHGLQGQPAEVRVSITASIFVPPAMATLQASATPPQPEPSARTTADGQDKPSAEKKPALLARLTASEVTLHTMAAESVNLALPAQEMAPAATAAAAKRHAGAAARSFAAGFPAARAGDAGSDNFVEVGALQSAALPASVLEQSRAAVRSDSMMRGLDELRQSVKASEEAEQRVVGATVAVGTSFSVGYVIWLLRGGVLATSLLSSLPAWRFVDPLPVLKQVMGEEEDDADDSLESIIGAGDTGEDDAAQPAQAAREGSK